MLPEPIQDDLCSARFLAYSAGDPPPAASNRGLSSDAGRGILTPEILLSEGYGPGPDASNETSRPADRVHVVEGGVPADLGSGGPSTPDKKTFGSRAQAVAARFDEAVRDDPRRAVGLAAVVGFGLGASLFATPLLRVVVGSVASVALKSDGAERIYHHVGAGLIDRLESMFGLNQGSLRIGSERRREA